MHVWRRGMFWTWGIRWAYLSLLSRTWHWPTQHFVLSLPLKNAFRARLPQNWNFQGQAKENSKKASRKKTNTAPGTQSETKVTKCCACHENCDLYWTVHIVSLLFWSSPPFLVFPFLNLFWSVLFFLSLSSSFLTFSDLSFSCLSLSDFYYFDLSFSFY